MQIVPDNIILSRDVQRVDGEGSFLIVGDNVEKMVQGALTYMGASNYPNASVRLHKLISKRLEEESYAVIASGGHIGEIAFFVGVGADKVIEAAQESGQEVH